MSDPVWTNGLVTIYCGDAREILPRLGSVDAVITDPVWPNTSIPFAGSDNPEGLLREVLGLIDADRVTIQLGCDTDPRFLSAVPDRWPFLRVCWLEYVRASYKGRVLYTGDVAYVFGEPPASEAAKRVLPGRYCSTRSEKWAHRKNGRNKRFSRELTDGLPHPAPRRLQHVQWLVKWFGGPVVLDPFLGSGTTALACIEHGRRCIGIEIEPRYVDLAINRVEQASLQLRLESEPQEAAKEEVER